MEDNSRLNSAIYFCGENIIPQRLKKMTIRNTDQKMTLKCQKRRKWIKHLDENTHRTTATSKQSKKLENGVKLTNIHKNFTNICFHNKIKISFINHNISVGTIISIYYIINN